MRDASLLLRRKRRTGLLFRLTRVQYKARPGRFTEHLVIFVLRKVTYLLRQNERVSRGSNDVLLDLPQRVLL